MTELVVNCCNFPFSEALGVSHGLLRLCRSLARHHELTFVANERADIDDGPAADEVHSIAARVIDAVEATEQSGSYRRTAIELLPHHFQFTRFCDRSVAICHDMHPFDVAWKYGKRAAGLQEKQRRVLTGATAVIAHFPRTYYALEHVAGISLPNLFLTESPLLLDTSPALTASNGAARRTEGATLLYPAQLQEHKNHRTLIEAVAALGPDERRHLRVLCPGSDFSAEITASLRSLTVELSVAEHIDFLGRVTDQELIDLYRECDGVIVPSLAEGGAYVALEAIAAGKPVAVNDIDSARMHADTMHADVLWFDSTDVAATADAVRRLVAADPDQWRHRNRECRDRIASLSWDGVAEKWNLVLEMIEGIRPRPILRTDRFAREVVLA